MDGGEKKVIPLDSGLDIKTGDMLSSVDSPLFTHNRQRWQGKTLPTSLRYEHDGWAAGNGVYNFKFRESAIEAGGLRFTSSAYNENPAKVINAMREIEPGIYEARGTYWFNQDAKIIRHTGLDGEPSIGHEDGKTQIDAVMDGNVMSIVYDNGTFSWDEARYGIEYETGADCITRFKIIDRQSVYHGYVDALLMPSPVTNKDGEVMQYESFENRVHTWKSNGNTLTYSVSDDVLKYNDTIIAHQISRNKISFELPEEFEADYALSPTYEDRYVAFKDAMIQQSSTNVVAGNDATWTMRQLDDNSKISTVYQKQVLMELPIWWGVTLIHNNIKVWHQAEDVTSRYIIADTRGGVSSAGKITIRAASSDNNWLGDSVLTLECTAGTAENPSEWTYSFDKMPESWNGENPVIKNNWNNSQVGFSIKMRAYAQYVIKMSSIVPTEGDIASSVSITPSPTKEVDGIYIDRSPDQKIKPEIYQAAVNSDWLTAKVALVSESLNSYQVFSRNGVPGHFYTGNRIDIDNSIGGSYAYQLPTHYDIYAAKNTTGTLFTINGMGVKASVLKAMLLTNVSMTSELLSTFDDKWASYADAMTVVIDNPTVNPSSGQYESSQPFRININGDVVQFNYDLYTKVYTLQTPSITVDGINVAVGFNNPELKFTATLENEYDTHFALSTDASRAVVSSDGKNINLDNDIVYDMELKNVYYDGILIPDASYNLERGVVIDFIYKKTASIDAVLYGIVRSDRDITWRIDGDSLFIDGIELSMESLFNDTDTFLDYYYTDVRDENLNEKKFATVNASGEYQFLKQGWDTTVATENFWWIDSTRYLSLDHFTFVLHKNNGTLHDWDGNNFDIEKKWLRSEYLPSTVLKYFCSCAYDGAYARFITISQDLTVRVYDVLDDFSVKTFNLNIVKHNLGERLIQDTTVLNTYAVINKDTFVSEASFSATVIGDYLLLGVHYDNNFNQWAVRYNLVDGSIFVLQGYGFVGPDGLLTGGELPERYFSVYDGGFNSSVAPMETLKNTESNITNVSDITNVVERIVGTENQQWYIVKTLSGIVSHVKMNKDGSFTHESIPITNNYAAIYASPSGMSSILSDYIGNIKPLSSIVSSEAGSMRAAITAAAVSIGMPIVFQYDPKVTTFMYLQQTVGQYAMVHYNNSNLIQSKDMTKESLVRNNVDVEEDFTDYVKPIDEDEISFDIQHINQSARARDTVFDNMITLIGLAALSVDIFATEKLKANMTQNQTQTSDKGRKFSQAFLQAVNNIAASDMTVSSCTPAVNSKITAVKTLDMFYSTSDTQQVSAGRGWVNHNFVSQCVAQSSTSLQTELSQMMSSVIFKALTLAQIKLEIKLLQAAGNGLHKLAQSIGGGNLDITGTLGGETSGVISSFGTGAMTAIAGSAVALAGTALLSMASHLESSMESIEQMLDAMGANTIHSAITARLSKHSYDIEGKHRYGSKSETFMYPCFSCSDNSIVDETAEASMQNKPWNIKIKLSSDNIDSVKEFSTGRIPFADNNISSGTIQSGDINYYIAMCKGAHARKNLPNRMAFVAGSESYLPPNNFKNENIGESEPVFPTHPFQDYILDERWQLSQTASVGMTTWIGCKDTKIIDGDFSNIVVSDNFCGVASPYTAIEVKRGIDKRYLRPWAVTPQALALNHTGFNCCYEEQAYHAFDGYGYRIIEWQGAPGMNKEHQTWQYCFLINDRFKRSNKMPQNEFLGNFKSEPTIAIKAMGTDKIFNLITQPGENVGLEAGTVGEDKDVRRYALPVFSEFVNTLPSAVKTIASYNLGVIDGITTLTTENRNLQAAYKAPVSIDFTIGKNLYRYTQEYICSVRNERGINVYEQLVPCLGLEFIGSTPYEAYFYSQATRQYYEYTGGSSLSVVDMIERFRDVVNGRYDFINQEVLLPCLATFMRVDGLVFDDSDETDNVMIPRLKNARFMGEVWPPLKNIFNTRSWFRTLSLPSGVTYQGPNRCIINRFVYEEYMRKSILGNYGLWKRVPRETYHPFRVYKAEYETVDKQIGDEIKVKGWTHNPFLLVTAPLGVAEEIDCLFEWEITFCWTIEMDRLYGADDYAVVNIQAQCMTPGGKVVADRPVHVFLTKELFTRTGNYGYYSFRYQGKCGIGNRERLHIWSDQYIAVSSLQVEYKPVTQKRTEILTQQVDIERLHEV